MAENKRILRLLLIVAAAGILAGCGNAAKAEQASKDAAAEGTAAADFPRDDIGVPDAVVMVDGTAYELEGFDAAAGGSRQELELTVETDTAAEIVLPVISPTHFWSLEETEEVSLVSYDKKAWWELSEELEGEVAALQRFKVELPAEASTYIRFKWANVNEIGRAFDDKAEDYYLCIVAKTK